ncbi:alpha/beta fold hydrolase [Enterovirga aerilata]|uniref:Alpha/beta fold hydrolase n=1 Tax=Enterovirga aerilata TaxID=2730920 RepID=A0A849HUL7_9HYPH|nr:alpha/beta fold hydrolase [Enterovirga sp. DB1703]NNM70802.1 alpha/beta fold hydrolase [Enterovirga sp. DB1703]
MPAGRLHRVDGISLHVLEAGPEDGPLVILLHGFPEFSHGWRHQVGRLAEAGFRVVVPDQRGYGRSDKPEGIGAYRIPHLAADVLGLAGAYGRERFHLAGHDWGGIVAFWLAGRHPERIDRLVIVNAPHPDAVRPFIRRHPAQLLRSSYVALFQLPGLPERLLAARDFLPLRRALAGTSRPGAFAERDLELYREAWARPGALAAMLNWYRALVQRRLPPAGRIRVPTRILWGRRDVALAPGLAEASLAMCDEGRIVWFDDATHWVLHEEPQAIAAEMVSFFGA